MEGSVMFIFLLFPVSPRHSTSPYLIAHAHDSFIMCVVLGALLIEYKNVNITYSKRVSLEGHDTTVGKECSSE